MLHYRKKNISNFIKYVIIVIVVRSVRIILFVQDPCLGGCNPYIFAEI